MAVNGDNIDAESIAKWFFQVDDPRQRDCQNLVQIAITRAVNAKMIALDHE